MPLRPPQISHGRTQDRTRASAVGGRVRGLTWVLGEVGAKPGALYSGLTAVPVSRICSFVSALQEIAGSTH